MKTESGKMKVVLFACATLTLGATAMASETIVTQTETVKYSRTEAATPVGAVKLYGALRAAASRACTERGMPMSGSSDAHAACKGAALSRAVSDVKIDAVTAAYLQDNGSKAQKGVVTVASR
jgi:UrcA family protein